MDTSNRCDQFEDELYSALGEILILGERVPPELRPLWEHATTCVDCLARVEEERSWNECLQTALASAPESGSEAGSETGAVSAATGVPQEALVLALSLAGAQWIIQVQRQAAWMGAMARITAGYAQGRGTEPFRPSIVEWRDFSVEVLPVSSSVQVTVYSRIVAVEGLVVRAMDDAGRCLDRKVTNGSGTATLNVEAKSSYQLAIEWPNGKPGPSVR